MSHLLQVHLIRFHVTGCFNYNSTFITHCFRNELIFGSVIGVVYYKLTE